MPDKYRLKWPLEERFLAKAALKIPLKPPFSQGEFRDRNDGGEKRESSRKDFAASCVLYLGTDPSPSLRMTMRGRIRMTTG
jgi:hypothetical protein